MAQSQRTHGGSGGSNGEFDPIGRLRSTLDTALSTFSSDATDEEGSVSDEDASGTTTATDGGTQAAEGATARDLSPSEFERMDPEDALYLLLCQEGGKMKQSEMVAELDWSKSKVSRRLSNLEDAGRIGRVRQGRQKVVFVKPGTKNAN
jgi:uncharacterized membrane protein